ncbi:selenocysteine lyase-like isoform X2 [Ornithodoros turicata]|uniref:selenocysteine lyase-like isoform X2 n=1 Tax=Ornithodoros turicata TaxID=34597 RepID=UPI003139B43A
MNGDTQPETGVYLDYNATTPMAHEVRIAVSNAMETAWGNPSSAHKAGVAARQIIETARKSVSQMIYAKPSEIIFTSGGTESNNMTIHSAIQHSKEMSHNLTGDRCPHIITSNIEHDSVMLPLKNWQRKGQLELTIVPVSKSTGSIVAEDVISHILPNTCLVTVMLANNETGIIQPIEEIGRLLRKENAKRKSAGLAEVLFHTDAAQALGKIDVNVSSLCVDYLTIVGHKFYGPRIGALYFRDSKPLYPMFFGGGQERGYRPGTENVCMIAGLGCAAELITKNIEEYRSTMKTTRDYLEKKLQEATRVTFNHHKGAHVLPNTCSVAFRGLNGHEILSQVRIQASTGAACHNSMKPSLTLLCSGVPEENARGTLRLTTGRETSFADIDWAIREIQAAVEKLSRMKGHCAVASYSTSEEHILLSSK